MSRGACELTCATVADLAVGPAMWVLCPYLFMLVCCPISTALVHERILLLRRVGGGDLPVSRCFQLKQLNDPSDSLQAHERSAATMRGGTLEQGEPGGAPPALLHHLQVSRRPQGQCRGTVHRVSPPRCVSQGSGVEHSKAFRPTSSSHSRLLLAACAAGCEPRPSRRTSCPRVHAGYVDRDVNCHVECDT